MPLLAPMARGHRADGLAELMETDVAADALLRAFSKKSTGCSTLDLLQRSEAHQTLDQMAPHVREEMVAIVQTDLRNRGIPARRRKPKPGAGQQRKPLTIPTIGEREGLEREQYIPGTPIARRLKNGRLIRTEGKPMPTIMTRQPRDDPHDHTVYQVGSPGRSASHGSGNSQSSGSSGRNSADSLKQRQEKLQNELLHVTQKLVRKYSKQFFPPTNRGSPNKTKYLADQWSHDECLSEADKYKMYMDGRYATTTHLDYYARDLEARDADNNKHKHHTQHTKYGDAIVMNRYSLRGKF